MELVYPIPMRFTDSGKPLWARFSATGGGSPQLLVNSVAEGSTGLSCLDVRNTASFPSYLAARRPWISARRCPLRRSQEADGRSPPVYGLCRMLPIVRGRFE